MTPGAVRKANPAKEPAGRLAAGCRPPRRSELIQSQQGRIADAPLCLTCGTNMRPGEPLRLRRLRLHQRLQLAPARPGPRAPVRAPRSAGPVRGPGQTTAAGHCWCYRNSDGPPLLLGARGERED